MQRYALSPGCSGRISRKYLISRSTIVMSCKMETLSVFYDYNLENENFGQTTTANPLKSRGAKLQGLTQATVMPASYRICNGVLGTRCKDGRPKYLPYVQKNQKRGCFYEKDNGRRTDHRGSSSVRNGHSISKYKHWI